MTIKNLKKLNRYTEGLESAQYLRDLVHWLNSRNEHLNENKNVTQLRSEFDKTLKQK